MKITRQKLFALPKPTIAVSKELVKAFKKADLLPTNAYAYLKNRNKYKFDKFRRNHMTDREILADGAASLVSKNSIIKSVFGKHPTKRNMDYVMSQTRLPYDAPTVNPYFNGKFNHLNDFPKKKFIYYI